MRARYRTAAYVAISAIIFISVPAVAAITERVKQDCRGDYQRYCNEYAIGSEALRACMSRSIKKVSNVCVRALVDAGEMSKAQADRLRKPTTSKHVTHKRTYHSKRTTKKRTTKR
ncbi:MAG TPA: hypothetical protein VFK91_01325 [Methyloceanibacter sp.]|nr:hypothetical protein [Methyloceanibacter sp.]